jgi:hypothetical protein
MSKLVNVLKGIGYVVVAYIAVDAAWRVAAGKGFTEMIGPAAVDLLEWLGLVKHKAASQFNQLTGSTQAAFDQFISRQTEIFKEILSKVNHHDPAEFNSLIEKSTASAADYAALLKELPQKIKELMKDGSFVADAANNLKLMGLAAGMLLLNAFYFFYKRGKYPGGKPKKRSRELTLENLTGVFVSNDIHSELRYHSSDNPFDVGTGDAGEAKKSLAASNLRQEIIVEIGEEVQICYFVPGKASFKLDIDSQNVAAGKVGENQFYVGLYDKKFYKAGEYEIRLSIVPKEAPVIYKAAVHVV